jgi:Zn-finger domain-containing protein
MVKAKKAIFLIIAWKNDNVNKIEQGILGIIFYKRMKQANLKSRQGKRERRSLFPANII